MDLLLDLSRALLSLVAMTVAVLVAPLVFMVIFGLMSGFNARTERAEDRE